MKKRILLSLMVMVCAAVILCALPVGAKTVASGDWEGGNILWSLSDDGTLTFSGKTHMQSSSSEYPWQEYASQVKKIVVEDGVTSVANRAFCDMPNLEVVELADSVKRIGENAFSNCKKLVRIDMPENLTIIEEYAFFGCSKLEAVAFPDSLTEIERYAFYQCTALGDVTFAQDGWLETIGQYAFAESGIEDVSTPHSLRTIDFHAFEDCDALTSVRLNDGVVEVKAYSFENCSNLKYIYVGSTIETLHGCFKECYAVETFESHSSSPYGFENCAQLKTVIIGGNAHRVPRFTGCTSLTTVIIEAPVTEVYDNAFSGCTSLTTLVLPDGVVEIAAHAFANSGITHIAIPSTVTNIGIGAFNSSSIQEIVFHGEEPVDVIYATEGLSATVYYPAGNENWEAYIQKYYAGEIMYAEYSKDLVWTPHSCDGNHVEETLCARGATCVSDGVTEGKRCYFCGEILVAQDEVPATGHSFGDWYVAKEATTLSSGLEKRKCGHCGVMEERTIDKLEEPPQPEPEADQCGENLRWKYANGVLTISGTGDMYDYDRFNMPPWTDRCDVVTKVVVKEGVTSLSHKAFIEFEKLEEISLPSTLKVIGGQAFKDCVSLTEVVLPEGLEEIGDFAFEKCYGLTRVYFPSTLEKIEMDAFNYCTSLQEIYFFGDAVPWLEGVFFHVNATAYYPAGNTTWTEAMRPTYEGALTWKTWCPNGHTEKAQGGKEPTCLEDGLTDEITCSACGKVLQTQQPIPATGHSFGEWAVILEPTVEAEGQEERTCTACGTAEQRAVAKLDPPETQPTAPAPTDPAPTDPVPTDPAPTDPAPTNPAPTDPQATQGATVQPGTTTPTQTDKEPAGNGWIIIVIIAVLALGAVAVVVVMKRKK